MPWRIEQRIHKGAVKYRFGEPEICHFSDLYDEEVRSFDQRFAELLVGLDGTSLRPLLERPETKVASRRLYAAQGRYRVARDPGLKVRYDLRTGAVEFRVPEIGEPEPADPGRAGAELLSALGRWLRQNERTTPAEGVRRAEELEAELEALGYL